MFFFLFNWTTDLAFKPRKKSQSLNSGMLSTVGSIKLRFCTIDARENLSFPRNIQNNNCLQQKSHWDVLSKSRSLNLLTLLAFGLHPWQNLPGKANYSAKTKFLPNLIDIFDNRKSWYFFFVMHVTQLATNHIILGAFPNATDSLSKASIVY